MVAAADAKLLQSVRALQRSETECVPPERSAAGHASAADHDRAWWSSAVQLHAVGRAVLLTMARTRISRRVRLAIAAVFVIVGLVFLFGPSPIGLWRQNEEQACAKKCSELKKFWRLVPAFEWPQVSPARSGGGPWKCECY